jgi:lipase maturation factor 1
VDLLNLELGIGSGSELEGRIGGDKELLLTPLLTLFRISFSLVKTTTTTLRNFRAMDYFYQSQPIPNPLSKLMHSLPKPWHTLEVLVNHVVELVLPFFFILPFRELRIFATVAHVVFQLVLISTGNLSFLNWLTITPLLFGFDDAFWSSVLGLGGLTAKASIAQYSLSCVGGGGKIGSIVRSITGAGGTFRGIIHLVMGAGLARLSVPVVRNLLDKNQLMNGSFDKYGLVSTYGAFGVVTEGRSELVIKASNEETGPWEEYSFKVKPGDVNRRPRWCSPYHHRLDWCMWMAGLGGEGKAGWVKELLRGLVEGRGEVMGLLGEQSQEVKALYENGGGPKFIKVDEYMYEFDYGEDMGPPSVSGWERGKVWRRKFVRKWTPKQGVYNRDDLMGGGKG